jgi:branched-subunit amino acid transport protein
MTPWLAVIIGSIAVFSWKYLGYLLPHSILDSRIASRISGYITVALLSALVGIQTFIANKQIQIDGRLVAVLVAAVLLRFKAPFIVVVIVAAVVAAVFRLAF